MANVLRLEFDRQIQNLIAKGYLKLLNLTESELLKLTLPLRDKLPDNLKNPDLERGYLPFVVVVKSGNVMPEKLMEAVEFNGKAGFSKLSPVEARDFKIISDMAIPDSLVYLLFDIDRGKETLNVRPEEALGIIKGKHRFPLTIDEGIAILTQYPEFLIKNNCFSLLASRTGKDQRVPAIWINAAKQANLGWCWDRNPHTWLGSASCKGRLG